MTMIPPKSRLNWISESEFVIGNKVYHSFNPKWLENLFEKMEKNYDDDPSKDKEASEPA